MSYFPRREEMALKDLCRLREELADGLGTEVRRIRAHMARNEQDLPYIFHDLKTHKSRAHISERFREDAVLMRRISKLSELLGHAKELDRELDAIARGNEDIQLLMSIPGVGARTGVQLMSMIIDINRFPDAEKLCSYFGMVPRVRSTGGKEIHGRLTKAGDPMMRRILDRVIYVHIVNCPSSVTTFYERKAGESKKKALTSASRKMLCLMYVVLKRRTPFTA